MSDLPLNPNNVLVCPVCGSVEFVKDVLMMTKENSVLIGKLNIHLYKSPGREHVFYCLNCKLPVTEDILTKFKTIGEMNNDTVTSAIDRSKYNSELHGSESVLDPVRGQPKNM